MAWGCWVNQETGKALSNHSLLISHGQSCGLHAADVVWVETVFLPSNLILTLLHVVGGLTPLACSMAADMFPVDNRASMLGIWGTALVAGLPCPSILGILPLLQACGVGVESAPVLVVLEGPSQLVDTLFTSPLSHVK